jgi:hypothetical protein
MNVQASNTFVFMSFRIIVLLGLMWRQAISVLHESARHPRLAANK